MQTLHKILFGDARRVDGIPDDSIALVVTSPPYPMIEMWDRSFAQQDPDVAAALERKDGNAAFERMHRLLDGAWDEAYRVLMPGGFACINIGDATRTVNDHFQLYPNHARILSHCVEIGFTNLPAVIWRKQTNAPNKFMGSGTLPAGAYVTLEHEFVLILRKGNRREFKTAAEKLNRSQSALFWEERNVWFSDVWFDLKGTQQKLRSSIKTRSVGPRPRESGKGKETEAGDLAERIADAGRRSPSSLAAGRSQDGVLIELLNHQDARKRSGAFPFELAYRLINMYSVRGDTVLDPFLGSGTTTLAALASCRNSIGVEIDPGLKKAIFDLTTRDAVKACNARIRQRIESHLAFVREREQARAKGKEAFRYTNENHGFPVITKPEVRMLVNYLKRVTGKSGDMVTATYNEEPFLDFPGEAPLFSHLP